MLDFKSSKLTTFNFDRSFLQSQSFLDWLWCVEFDVGDTFAFATSLISDNSDISDFTALSLTEKGPDVFFTSFQGQTIH